MNVGHSTGYEDATLRGGAADLGAGQALLMEALCERLLRHGDVDLWRQVFLGSAYETIRFETSPLTLLATDDPLADISASEGAELAARLGGRAEPSKVAELVLSFRRATDALRAGVILQRLAGRRQIRSVLSTAPCTVASFELQGGTCRMVVGREIERAESGVRQAAAGTIMVSAETYAVLGDRIDQLSDGLVIAEMQDETVMHATITLAPHGSADMSTFAGLGLV